jgi:hypothetical protein
MIAESAFSAPLKELDKLEGMADDAIVTVTLATTPLIRSG